MPRSRAPVMLLALGLLSACGTDPGDRAGGGAAVGAGTGAAIGAVAGGVGAIPGALIGAAVGAGTGAATQPDQVNLGEPVWDRDKGSNLASRDAGARPASNPTVWQAQRQLQEQGFYRGPLDGIAGPDTEAALRSYQARNGLPESGMLDPATQARLGIGASAGSSGVGATATDATGSGSPSPR